MTSEAVGFSTIDALRLTTDFGTEKYLVEGDELTLSASTNYEGPTYARYGREFGGTYSQIGDECPECPECHMGGGEHAPGCSYGGDPGGY